MSKLAFVDIETTGVSTHADRVIEIGIVVLEGGKVRKKYKQLVDPEMRVNQFITSVTGITNADLDGAPTFHQVAEEVLSILDGATFVAHNVGFDYGFLKAEFERAGYEFRYPHFCTVRLSRHLYPKQRRHGLDQVIERHGIKCKNRHRALDDALVICKFYQQELKRLGEERLAKAVAAAGKRVTWPLHIPREDINALPNTPGVYVFYGENDAPLYVGKSTAIRTRVISHFNESPNSSKEMKLAQLVRRIEAHPTPGELGALLKESAMVKSMMPIYNRMLRQARQLTVLKGHQGEDGYLRMKIETANEDDIRPDQVDSIYGVFRSKRQATNALQAAAEEHRICKKLLGLENTKRSCFGRQLKKCDGACVGEEPAALFNARFELAFLSMRFKRWPFEGQVKVVEESAGKREVHVIDRWCVFPAGDGQELAVGDYRFDVDTYKILRRFLADPKNHRLLVFDGAQANRYDFSINPDE